jgi:Ca2+-binding EF-hand superfamily protein
MLKRFDADGDGVLNETEREAMRKAIQARRGGPGGERPDREEMMKRFDADGDGVLSDEERAAMEAARKEHLAERQQLREEMLKRFDADGDGQLSEEERNTMRETMKAERSETAPTEESEAAVKAAAE